MTPWLTSRWFPLAMIAILLVVPLFGAASRQPRTGGAIAACLVGLICFIRERQNLARMRERRSNRGTSSN